MKRDQLPPLSECCQDKYIKIVDKTLIDILRHGEKQRVLCKSFEYLKWDSCEKRSEYYKVLMEVYMDLSIYIKDDFYDLTRHAKKMKDFDLDRLSAEKKPDPRDWKGFLLSVVNLAFRAVGSERLPQDITIELMKVKFEDLDYEGKYYFRDLLEEEWKVLLDYHNYLQTSLHYVKADTNDLPLMESSAFLAGIYKCLQGSFKSLGKEAKRLHIIYKELIKGQEKPSRKVKGSEQASLLSMIPRTISSHDLDDWEIANVLCNMASMPLEEYLNDHDDNDNESVDSNEFSGPIGGFTETIKPYVKKDSSTTALPPGNKVMEMLHTFNGTSGASYQHELPKGVYLPKEYLQPNSNKRPGVWYNEPSIYAPTVKRRREETQGNDRRGMKDVDGDDYADDESIDSNTKLEHIGSFTEAIKSEVTKDPSVAVLPEDTTVLWMIHSLHHSSSSQYKEPKATIAKQKRTKEDLPKGVLQSDSKKHSISRARGQSSENVIQEKRMEEDQGNDREGKKNADSDAIGKEGLKLTCLNGGSKEAFAPLPRENLPKLECDYSMMPESLKTLAESGVSSSHYEEPKAMIVKEEKTKEDPPKESRQSDSKKRLIDVAWYNQTSTNEKRRGDTDEVNESEGKKNVDQGGVNLVKYPSPIGDITEPLPGVKSSNEKTTTVKNCLTASDVVPGAAIVSRENSLLELGCAEKTSNDRIDHITLPLSK